MTDHQAAFSTNMSRLHGWTSGTIKEIIYDLASNRSSQYDAIKKLKRLTDLMDTIWEANRENRIVDFDEYKNPSKKANS